MSEEEQRNRLQREFKGWVQPENSVFGAEIKKHDALRTTIEKEGVRLEWDCSQCSGATAVVLEWPELLCIQNNANPTMVLKAIMSTPALMQRFSTMLNGYTPATFGQREGGWSLQISCSEPSCNSRRSFVISAADARSWCENGKLTGIVKGADDQGIYQVVQQLHQQRRR